MNQLLAIPRETSRNTVCLSGVAWRTYSRLLRALENQPGLRLTYDRGELEIMSPRLEHDDDGRFLGAFVLVLAEELGITIRPGGSATLRRRMKKKGIEPDECFWLANAPLMAGRRRLDLRKDPPPDLAIEVDVTSSSLDRMGIYSALGVPEVWRLEGDTLSFHVLGTRRRYREVTLSQSFPLVSPGDLVSVLQKARGARDFIPVIRQFRRWVRRRRSPRN